MDLPFDSRHLFLAVLAFVVLERVVELVLTRRNAARLQKRGGIEVGATHFLPMAILHTALLIAAPAEVFLLDRPWMTWVSPLALLTVAATMGLRYWAIASLGDRWTARVFVVPGEPPVVRGPYRWLRHPNYLAVILEVAALPLVHGAWLTALVCSIVNAFVLRTRIRVEETALEEASDYLERFADKPRFLP